MKQTVVHLHKDSYKFSAAHMTVFHRTEKEALHGHTYRVAIEIGLVEAPELPIIPFEHFKKPILAICHQWDEKVLLPRASPYLKVIHEAEQAEFTLCGKRYSLPSDEVVWLPVDNVTTENLSREFLSAYAAALEILIKEKRINQIKVTIEETPGLGSSTHWQLN